MIRGTLQVGDAMLRPGDGAGVTQTDHLALTALDDVEALVFDLL